MIPPSGESAHPEIYVIVAPDDKELCSLLARRRFNRIALMVAPIALLLIGVVVAMNALGRDPGLTDHTTAQRRPTAGTVEESRGLLVPIHVPVKPERVDAPALGERQSTPEPLAPPTPPASAIEAQHSGVANLADSAATMVTKTEPDGTPSPGPLTPPSVLRDPAREAQWVVTLRNGSEFVVERAMFGENWVTLWVDHGVVALPIDDVSAHGRRDR